MWEFGDTMRQTNLRALLMQKECKTHRWIRLVSPFARLYYGKWKIRETFADTWRHLKTDKSAHLTNARTKQDVLQNTQFAQSLCVPNNAIGKKT